MLWVYLTHERDVVEEVVKDMATVIRVLWVYLTHERDVVEEAVKEMAKEVQDEVDYLDETDNTESEMFTFIEEDSFIGVYSSSKSLELFYILKVIEKAIAEDDIIDIYGHLIQKGAQYIKGFYLEKVDERKNNVFYKQLNKTVYVYPAEIFCPAVPIDKNGLYISVLEYIFLADSL